MCDCAEELERRERAKAEELANAMAALRAQSQSPSLFQRILAFLGGSGGDGAKSKWTTVGGAALLIGLLGFLYKNFGDRIINLLFGGIGSKKAKDPCEGQIEAKKRKPPPPDPVKPCQCN